LENKSILNAKVIVYFQTAKKPHFQAAPPSLLSANMPHGGTKIVANRELRQKSPVLTSTPLGSPNEADFTSWAQEF